MLTIANYLYIAAYSGEYNKKDWQNWADKQILKNNIVENWIYDVSIAKTLDELSEVLSNKIVEENYYKYNEYPPSDAVIGYYYIRYKKGLMTINELLEKSGDEADAGEASLPCEFFYDLIEKLLGEDNSNKQRYFKEQLENIFNQFQHAANIQKKALENY